MSDSACPAGRRSISAGVRWKRWSRSAWAAYADHFPHALSGGQQQRVALARALAPNPAVLLLDEPFSGLDARLREQVRDETLHVLKRTGAATMLVTHDPEEAMFLADRIALMRAGKMVQLGSPVDLYNRPADGFAASFFGEVNRIDGTVRQGAVDTPVGRIPTDLPEGSAAQVMIRPEALHLAPLDGSGKRHRSQHRAGHGLPPAGPDQSGPSLHPERAGWVPSALPDARPVPPG